MLESLEKLNIYIIINDSIIIVYFLNQMQPQPNRLNLIFTNIDLVINTLIIFLYEISFTKTIELFQ